MTTRSHGVVATSDADSRTAHSAFDGDSDNHGYNDAYGPSEESEKAEREGSAPT